jgi:DMSO reductase family type II enzyme chaperone
MATIFSGGITPDDIYPLKLQREPMSTPSEKGSIPQMRSYAYGLLAATFDYPDAELAELISSGQYVKPIKSTLCAIYPEFEDMIDWPSLAVNDSEEELQVEFTRLFDAAAAGPLCPLNGGVYKGERMPTLEEMVRFYNYFGLTAGDEFEELPDHITTQLEFMHFLARCEDEHSNDSEEAANYQRAQRDFLNRHLAKWIPQMEQKAKENNPRPFYLTLITLLSSFVQAEQRSINEATGFIMSS